MTYPYIGKIEETGNTIIFLNENKGMRISEPFDFICTRDKWKESVFKNITAEYLANTYGEVKSKEHAEFIVKLCENAGINVFPQLFDANHFVIKGKLSFHNCERITSSELKQITIPLPPECEEKIYRYEGMGHKPKHSNCVCTKCGGRCCIGNCGEWPKVGDDAEICESPAFELSVKSSKFIGKKGIVRAKFENSDGVMVYVLEVNTENVFCFHLQNIKKPKTPEQELREFLHLLWRENNEDFDDFADIAVLHLTKKGEGDE